MKVAKPGEQPIDLPCFIKERMSISKMLREDLEIEYAKITPEQIEQLDP